MISAQNIRNTVIFFRIHSGDLSVLRISNPFNRELIRASKLAESRSALETDEDTDIATGTKPPNSDRVEIEILPPNLSVPTSHRHLVMESSNEPAGPLEKRPAESNGSAD
ncbi:hypothetical protein [Natronococcus roseus]|uniref:hypothetical protein n=1 Tax=Natronococcus roseus TaxID=1052014 RepID=UPI00374DF78F